MIRRLSEAEARLFVPLADAAEHERERAELMRLLALAQHTRAAFSRLEADVRSRLPGLLTELLSGEARVLDAAVRALVDRELSRLAHALSLRVRVHSDSLHTLSSSDELRARHELAGALELIADDTLSPGGVLIESEFGERDARLETRIASFVSALLSGSEAP